MSRHLAGMLARAIERAPEGKRSAEAVRIAAALVENLQALTDGKSDLDDDEPVDPGRVLVALLQRLPDGTASADRAPANAAARHDGLHKRTWRARRWARASRRSAVGRRDRRRHGVRPLEWRASIDGCASAPLRGRQAVAGPDDDVHEQHGAARARRAGAARRRDQGVIRHLVDTTPRQGVDLPPRKRLLDRVHRLVEPHALGAGSRARMERPRLRRAQSGRGRKDGGGLHELLGEQGLRALRCRGVQTAHAGDRS